MSKPTIWTIKMPDNTLTKWVKLEEYARLQAENSYLKGEDYPYTELGSMMPKYLLDHWVNENARLKAEVDRLRKAGDYLADHLAHEFGTCPSIEIWNAAKDGKR